MLVNGADGISDIEGKAVTDSGEQAGMRASFNEAVGVNELNVFTRFRCNDSTIQPINVSDSANV